MRWARSTVACLVRDAEDGQLPAGELNLGHERQAADRAIAVERRQDLLPALHPDDVTTPNRHGFLLA
jgi:hypothetical protein